MSYKMTEQEWLKEFQDFVEAKEVEVPEELSHKILRRVYEDLNPSSWLVFSKLLAVHAVVGTLSLAICDQFGMNPFNTGFSLSRYFMKFGHNACMAMCGFVFLSLTVLISKNILRREEFFVLQKNLLLQGFFLSLISLAAFLAFGAEVIAGAAILWVIGAVLGSFVTMQILNEKNHLARILN